MGDTAHLSLIELPKTPWWGRRVFSPTVPFHSLHCNMAISTLEMAAVSAQVDGIARNHHTSSDSRSLYCRN